MTSLENYKKLKKQESLLNERLQELREFFSGTSKGHTALDELQFCTALLTEVESELRKCRVSYAQN